MSDHVPKSANILPLPEQRISTTYAGWKDVQKLLAGGATCTLNQQLPLQSVPIIFSDFDNAAGAPTSVAGITVTIDGTCTPADAAFLPIVQLAVLSPDGMKVINTLANRGSAGTGKLLTGTANTVTFGNATDRWGIRHVGSDVAKFVRRMAVIVSVAAYTSQSVTVQLKSVKVTLS